MSRRARLMVVGLVAALTLATVGTLGVLGVQAQARKAPGGRAGAIAAPGVQVPRIDATAIKGAVTHGAHCTIVTPNVHHLGWVPADVEVQVDFESIEGSDPIATLTAIRMDGTDLGQEWEASNDAGGTLDPEFRVTKPYDATYVLTVGDARGEMSCYFFSVTLK